MTFLQRWFADPEALFRRAFTASLVFHLLLFAGFSLRDRFFSENRPDNLMEIDLTKPFRVGGDPRLRPGGGTTTKPVQKEGAPGLLEEPQTEKKMPPKDWVLPGPETKVIEKPVPEGNPSPNRSPDGVPGGSGEGWQGTGGGWGGGEGEGGGIPLTRFPKLLNQKEILRLLRRNFPAAEREAGRSGEVVVELHLSAEGQVTGVEVVGSGGQNFDAVAAKVARKMKFSPAMMQSTAVPVKIRQTMIFQMTEDEE